MYNHNKSIIALAKKYINAVTFIVLNCTVMKMSTQVLILNYQARNSLENIKKQRVQILKL